MYNKNILIADDEEDILRLYDSIFKNRKKGLPLFPNDREEMNLH